MNQKFVSINFAPSPPACDAGSELVSGSKVPQTRTVLVARWMLKQVQHDGVGWGYRANFKFTTLAGEEYPMSKPLLALMAITAALPLSALCKRAAPIMA